MSSICYAVKYRVLLIPCNWARYINRINRQDLTEVNYCDYLIKYLPNRLISLYFKIYYKEENYLKARTAVFKYITSPIVKV